MKTRELVKLLVGALLVTGVCWLVHVVDWLVQTMK